MTEGLPIPLPLKVSTNKFYAGMHHRDRSAIAHVFHAVVLEAARKNRVPKITLYPVKLLFTFHLYGTPLDLSNCTIMAKMLEDGLVRAGVLAGDTLKHVAELAFREECLPKVKGRLKQKDMVYIRVYQ